VLLGWKKPKVSFGRPFVKSTGLFSGLKDVIEMRPIYHQTEHRVGGRTSFIAFFWPFFTGPGPLEKKKN